MKNTKVLALAVILLMAAFVESSHRMRRSLQSLEPRAPELSSKAKKELKKAEKKLKEAAEGKTSGVKWTLKHSCAIAVFHKLYESLDSKDQDRCENWAKQMVWPFETGTKIYWWFLLIVVGVCCVFLERYMRFLMAGIAFVFWSQIVAEILYHSIFPFSGAEHLSAMAGWAWWVTIIIPAAIVGTASWWHLQFALANLSAAAAITLWQMIGMILWGCHVKKFKYVQPKWFIIVNWVLLGLGFCTGWLAAKRYKIRSHWMCNMIGLCAATCFQWICLGYAKNFEKHDPRNWVPWVYLGIYFVFYFLSMFLHHIMGKNKFPYKQDKAHYKKDKHKLNNEAKGEDNVQVVIQA